MSDQFYCNRHIKIKKEKRSVLHEFNRNFATNILTHIAQLKSHSHLSIWRDLVDPSQWGGMNLR